MPTYHNLSELTWLAPHWQQLRTSIIAGRLPQALLITGNAGLGKQTLARHFAQSLLCTERLDGDFCGNCQSCILFCANTHPDFYLLSPEEEGKNITVAQIRNLTQKLTLKPQHKGQRTIILHPADKLNNAAANAFLKYLEEPGIRTSILLISDKPTLLPATVRSRCQKMFIATPSAASSCEWLAKHAVANPLALSLAKGAPLLAWQFSKNELLPLRTSCLDSWLQLANGKIGVVAVSDKWAKLEKNQLEFVLFCLITCLSDMVKLKHNQRQLDNPDYAQALAQAATPKSLQKLYHYYDFLLLCQKRLAQQLNKQLLLEELLLEWHNPKL